MEGQTRRRCRLLLSRRTTRTTTTYRAAASTRTHRGPRGTSTRRRWRRRTIAVGANYDNRDGNCEDERRRDRNRFVEEVVDDAPEDPASPVRKCDNQHSRRQSRGGCMGWEGWRWEKGRRWWRWRCDAPSRAGGGRGEDDYDGDNDDRGIVRGLVSVIARLCHNDVDGTMEPRGGDARGRGRRRRVTRRFAGR